jgi:hypothetical protein
MIRPFVGISRAVSVIPSKFKGGSATRLRNGTCQLPTGNDAVVRLRTDAWVKGGASYASAPIVSLENLNLLNITPSRI